MKILVACEYSGTVRDAFSRKGWDAFSCDLLPTESELTKSEGKHYQGDIFDFIGSQKWDLLIGHPPCTYLSRAGARWLFANGELNHVRYTDGLRAKIFFEKLLNADIPYICIENPTPMKIFDLPECSQVIQPYQFGHGFSKRTLLWLKNLPNLEYTNILTEYIPYLPSNTGGAKRGQKHTNRSISQKEASRTFSGIADAMAGQWTKYILENE